MSRRLTQTAVATLFATIGVLAALVVAPAALAWTPDNLPPGWTVDHIQNVGATSCPSAYRIRTATAGVFSDPFCEDSPTYQQDFDGYVDAHYTAPPATTTTPATTATPTDTTVTVTDPTTTAATPAPPAPAPVTTAQTTTATDPVIADLQSQIDALRAELRQLVCLLQTSTTLDPGILATLMSMEACS